MVRGILGMLYIPSVNGRQSMLSHQHANNVRKSKQVHVARIYLMYFHGSVSVPFTMSMGQRSAGFL